MHSKANRFGKDDEGVSPVIGVILMVAITVVMAAIVSSWSAGVKAPTTPTTVGLDISRSGTIITTTVTAIDPSANAPLSNLSFTYQNYSAGMFIANYTGNTSVDVGFSRSLDTNSSSTNLFIVTSTFKDGSKRVLYSQNI